MQLAIMLLLIVGGLYSYFRMREIESTLEELNPRTRQLMILEIAGFVIIATLVITGWHRYGWYTWIWVVNIPIVFVGRIIKVNWTRWLLYASPGEADIQVNSRRAYRSGWYLLGLTVQEVVAVTGLLMAFWRFLYVS